MASNNVMNYDTSRPNLLSFSALPQVTLDHANQRASGVGRPSCGHPSATVEAIQKENVALKAQNQWLLREKEIIGRAVVNLYNQQQEQETRHAQELEDVKQLLKFYQEKVKSLEEDNLSLARHLQPPRNMPD